jgi:hypothetical protein
MSLYASDGPRSAVCGDASTPAGEPALHHEPPARSARRTAAPDASAPLKSRP